jgi:ABC-type transport system substrate-binding protein
MPGFEEKPLGSGPWKLVKHEIGQFIEYEANLDCWNSECIPGFAKLRMVLVPESRTRVAMLKRGEAEYPATVPIRRRQPARLEPWLRHAATSTLTPFRRFAKGLRADMAAVQAAVTLPWRQGPIEGHINHLKMLKCQIFGRDRFDLLARRFSLAA